MAAKIEEERMEAVGIMKYRVPYIAVYKHVSRAIQSWRLTQ